MDAIRYNRQIILPEVGETGQHKLSKAKVLVIGAGGLGAAILPYLAAAGVGEIGIVDDDAVEVSNLQRQVIYQDSAIGKPKAEEAKRMLNELNPLVMVHAVAEKLSRENAVSLFEKYDIIVDATDSITTKYLINDVCVFVNKPMVYGSVFRFQGQVSVFNYQNGPTYRCLFPDESKIVTDCNTAGVMGVTVGIIGMLQANEVIKMILETGEVLSGKLLIYDTLHNEQQKYDFEKNTDHIGNEAFFKQSFNSSEITIEEALNARDRDDILFLDVRNTDELPKMNFKNSIQIPLPNVEGEIEKLNRDETIYIYCQSGIRSKIAAELLRKHHFKNIKSIEGGVLAMQEVLKKETVTD